MREPQFRLYAGGHTDADTDQSERDVNDGQDTHDGRDGEHAATGPLPATRPPKPVLS